MFSNRAATVGISGQFSLQTKSMTNRSLCTGLTLALIFTMESIHRALDEPQASVTQVPGIKKSPNMLTSN